MPNDYALTLLSAILQHFASFHGGVPLEVVTNTSPRLIKLLETGELDLAILATDRPRNEDVELRREPIEWVASPDHDLTRRPLALALFSDESLIYRATIASLPGLAVAGDQSSVDVRIGLRSSSWSALTAAAATGFAVATMARSVVAPGLCRLGLRGISRPWRNLYRHAAFI